MMQSTHSTSSQASGGGASTAKPSPDAKVRADLAALSDQISLCQSMLGNAGGPSTLGANNEALLTVLGFLEACVPRMVELIEAAAQGALSAETFEECLVVNDNLTNVLADVEREPQDRRPLTPAAAAPSGEAAAGDLDEGMNKLSVGGSGDADATLVGGKTTGLESGDASNPPADDPFAGGPDLLAPSPPTDAFKISESMGSTGSAPEAAAMKAGADDDDDFDAFLRDRTSAP